jgi:hypothetical protein
MLSPVGLVGEGCLEGTLIHMLHFQFEILIKEALSKQT